MAIFICVSGLRRRASVWYQLSPTTSLGTHHSTNNKPLKMCSTAIITLQALTHLSAPNPRWRLTARQSDQHPVTARALIQFRVSKDWTLRQQLRFWTRQKVLDLWELAWTPQAAGVRVTPTLLRDTVVIHNIWFPLETFCFSQYCLGWNSPQVCANVTKPTLFGSLLKSQLDPHYNQKYPPF